MRETVARDVMAFRAVVEPMLMRVMRRTMLRERRTARRGMWRVGET